jgi:hypothetical protein
MVEKQSVLFDERFLDKHAGSIIADTAVAIVELVANAWDAYASEVDITWPDSVSESGFAIVDNGKGMTAEMFEQRWRKLDYNRVIEEGVIVAPPEELKKFGPRRAYGRNGRGRHASFRFSDPYTVRTWRDGVEVTYEVSRGNPFDITLLHRREGMKGHGTEISAISPRPVGMTADEVREVIGTRFLFDPNFQVSVDGRIVTFDDIPPLKLKEADVEVPAFGTAHVYFVDAIKADRTTRQHGIAWRVNSRLVGTPSWVAFDQERVLDGRTTEAKRFQVIVQADFLADSVLPDWNSFEARDEAWRATRDAVHAAIREFLSSFTAVKRGEAKESVKDNLSAEVSKLPPIGRDRWNAFVDQVIDSCPTISTNEVQQVAGILANLELSTSKYGLVHRLHNLKPGDLDELNHILVDWTVRTAKLALDEIQSRLKLIEELDHKLRDNKLDEVSDLQPLFERSLWVFGPEFESIEFTSNRGMTEVIQKLFGKKDSGSRNRPDFAVLPDGSVGFYSRDSHDLGHDVAGVARLVVAEIKKVGITIGSEEKEQPWKYVKELREKGLVTETTSVTCFVLGSKIDPNETGDDTRGNNRVIIRAMTYNTFIRRAEARMLGLRNKLREAPFLKEHGVDGSAFIEPPAPRQAAMDFAE